MLLLHKLLITSLLGLEVVTDGVTCLAAGGYVPHSHQSAWEKRGYDHASSRPKSLSLTKTIPSSMRRRRRIGDTTSAVIGTDTHSRLFSATGTTSENPEDTNEDVHVHAALNQRGGATSASPTNPTNPTITTTNPNPQEMSIWPSFDTLDKKLIKIALPCIANFAINPLVGAIDLFWVNRMGNALAVAGQSAANQVFSSAFWLTSFLPSVTATLVAKESAKRSKEGIQDAVCQALTISFYVAIVGSVLILKNTDKVLSSVLLPDAPAREFAIPYLLIRGFAFLPSLVSLVGFSAFRGMMDTVTPLKISLFANLVNAVLDPMFIFWANMGVTGAALATLISEVVSCACFTTLMFRRNIVTLPKLFRLPKGDRLSELLKGGAALQLRNFALNLTFLSVTRVTQSIDDTGVAAAAHAMAIQTFQIGGIVLLALSTVAQTVVPNEMIEKVDEDTGEKSGGLFAAKATVNRLMGWGFILGTILGMLQILLIPLLQMATPIEAVRKAARTPALLASIYQVMNGLVFIGEGTMVGCGNFLHLSLSTVVATAATLVSLYTLPQIYGLTGVWMSFGVFNSLRLLGVWLHQSVRGPLASRFLNAPQRQEDEVSLASND